MALASASPGLRANQGPTSYSTVFSSKRAARAPTPSGAQALGYTWGRRISPGLSGRSYISGSTP